MRLKLNIAATLYKEKVHMILNERETNFSRQTKPTRQTGTSIVQSRKKNPKANKQKQ